MGGLPRIRRGGRAGVGALPDPLDGGLGNSLVLYTRNNPPAATGEYLERDVGGHPIAMPACAVLWQQGVAWWCNGAPHLGALAGTPARLSSQRTYALPWTPVPQPGSLAIAANAYTVAVRYPGAIGICPLNAADEAVTARGLQAPGPVSIPWPGDGPVRMTWSPQAVLAVTGRGGARRWA